MLCRVIIRSKFITPTLSEALKYTLSFNNAFYNPHSGHNASAGGIISSTGFKISGDTTNEHFLDDDGAGILRLYYLSGTTRVYTNTSYGTVNYTTGEVVLTSANITSISNVDGATSTQIRVTTVPSSNDIVPVRNQVLEIDTTNSSVLSISILRELSQGLTFLPLYLFSLERHP